MIPSQEEGTRLDRRPEGVAHPALESANALARQAQSRRRRALSFFFVYSPLVDRPQQGRKPRDCSGQDVDVYGLARGRGSAVAAETRDEPVAKVQAAVPVHKDVASGHGYIGQVVAIGRQSSSRGRRKQSGEDLLKEIILILAGARPADDPSSSGEAEASANDMGSSARVGTVCDLQRPSFTRSVRRNEIWVVPIHARVHRD